MPSNVTFQTINTGEVNLRVVVQGEGPLCVLVHGFPESWYSYRHQIPALVNAGYRVAVPDVRGYGGSDKPEAIEAYDMVSLTDDVAGLIDALGEQQAVLIGHDWGAPIVWTTAIRHRARVRAVVGMSVPHLGRGPRPLIDTLREIYKDRFFYQLYFQEPGKAEAEFEADPKGTLRRLYYFASGDRPEGFNGFSIVRPQDSTMFEGVDAPTELPSWLTEEDLDYYAKQFEKSGFRGPLSRYRNSQRDFDRMPELADEKVTQPALFITGERDEVMHFVPGVKLHDLMDPFYADLRGKHEIAGAGHWVQQERPQEVNRLLLDFLSTL